MKTSKWIGIASLSVVLFVVTSTVVLSKYYSKTENAFSIHGEHAQPPDYIPHDELIIEYENIKITADEFHQYKNNVELMANYQETDHSLTNKQLIENMMKEKLVLAYAKEKGIEASDEEAIQYAEEQRIILDEAASEEVQEFRDQLIKSKGMSPEEYWSDAQTIQDYKNWIT